MCVYMEHLKDAPLYGRLQAVNACQGQTLYLIMNTLNYGRKKFYTIWHWDDIPQTSCKPSIMSDHKLQFFHL